MEAKVERQMNYEEGAVFLHAATTYVASIAGFKR